jgi:ATP-binding cassette subfamily F protein 3
MLQIQGVSKSFGSKILFEGVRAHLDSRSRIALVGPNGSGKSTLIKMILGMEHPDQGSLALHPHVRVGHLAQELPKFEDRSILDEVMSLGGRRGEILARKEFLEKEMQTLGPEASHTAVLAAYSKVLEELDAFDEFRLPSRAERILEGVGFRVRDFGRKLSGFSGGWLMRVALARVLLLNPDLLILDEPTNHLDLESLLWLEEFLKGYPGAILMVSHDRVFLNKLVNGVWEIDQRRIETYSGDLDAFVTQKEERLKVLEARAQGQEAKAAELRAFIERFGAKASKARQAQSRMKQLEKLEQLEKIELPQAVSGIGFRFPPCPKSGSVVATIKNLEVRVGAGTTEEKTLFSGLDWIVKRGTRTAIVGVNGAGKTTLLRALAHGWGGAGFGGGPAVNADEFRLGHEVRIGYYSQLQAETLDLESTILEELESTAPTLEISRIRGVAGAFLFHGDDVKKKIKVLSGGEKARVALAKLLLTPNNFLLLDEPTNHLDADSREVLLQALQNYDGTLCVVSHDRDFVGPLADQLLEIENQKVIPLVIPYEEYLEKKTRETREKIRQSARSGGGSAGGSTAPTLAAATRSLGPEERAVEPRAPKVSNNQRRSWEREFQEVEAAIADLEARIHELNDLIASGDFEKDPAKIRTWIDEQSALQLELEAKMNRWEELGGLL